MSVARGPSLVVFGDSLSDNGNLFALIGFPKPPDFDGRFSNGPVYAEYLARDLHVRLDDRAFGAAEASDRSVPVLTDPATGAALPINLSNQVSQYLAGLHGRHAPRGTQALINIGSNDYDSYLSGSLPKDAATAQTIVTQVVGAVEQAVEQLTAAGVHKIVLFTLPDFAITPLAQAAGPAVAAFAHQLDVANNAGLQQIAAAHPNVQLVDAFQVSDALFADPTSFGFTANLDTVTWTGLLAAGSTQYAPNEVAFFDGEHPTTAAHDVLAAFADASLTSQHVQLLDGTQNVVHAQRGSDLIFAAPIDPSNPALHDDYLIFGAPGHDIIFAGSGNVTVHGGGGTDLIAAGSGNAKLFAGNGIDVLETNSLGTNQLVGASGQDALIVNRGGTNTLTGGSGHDLFVLKENAGLLDSDGTFDFGSQTIVGGHGHDTLRFIINDQSPQAEAAFIDEFHTVETAFDAAAAAHHRGTFAVDGLNVTGVTRLELQVDSVSHDPSTPYLITHSIIASDGVGGHVSAALQHLLTTADHFGLLAV